MNTKLKAALKMSTLTPDGKVTKAQFIIASMQAAPTYFPAASLPFPYASATTAINNLNAATLAAESGAAGTVSNMHEKERILVSILTIYRAYVEMVANNSADPKTIIEAAGMNPITQSGSLPVSELTVTASGNGVITISVPRQAGEVAFIYQYSSDAGLNWQDFMFSKIASVQLTNQTPGANLHFRFAAIGKTRGAFSQVKSTFVL